MINMFTLGKPPARSTPVKHASRVETVRPVTVPTSELDNHTGTCFACTETSAKEVTTNTVVRKLVQCLSQIVEVASSEFSNRHNSPKGRSQVQKNCIGPIAKMMAHRNDIAMLVTNGNGEASASNMSLSDQIKQDFIKILVLEFKNAGKKVVMSSRAFDMKHNDAPRERQLHVKFEANTERRSYPDGSVFNVNDAVMFDPLVLGIAVASKSYPQNPVHFKSTRDTSIGDNRVVPSKREAPVNVSRFRTDGPSPEQSDEHLNHLYVTEDGEYKQASLAHFYERQDALAGRRVKRRF